MTLAQLLQQLLDHVYGLWPIRVVREWEQGVRLFCGRVDPIAKTSENGLWGTGLHLFWPLVGDLIRYPANIDVVETPVQTVRLACGAEVTFSLGLRYRVKDAPAFFMRIYDDKSTVSETCRSAAAAVAQRGSLSDFVIEASCRRDVTGAIAIEARRQMHGWGVDVLRVQLINLTTAQSLRLIQDVPRSPSRQEEVSGG